jgi:hypothetical protein
VTNRLFLFAAGALLAAGGAASACSICDPLARQSPTLREAAKTSKVIALVTAACSRLEGDRGVTDFTIDRVVRGGEAFGERKTLSLPGYVAVDPKRPTRFLLLGDVTDGKLDVRRSPQVRGAGLIDYLGESLKIEERERDRVLQFCYKHLDDADPDVAADAFLEFARASDQEIAALGRKLSPEKFRKSLKDPATPAERVGIFAYLLGSCGTKEDADLLAGMVRAADERSEAGLSGLLAGLIELRSKDGWSLAAEVLRDPKRSYAGKLSAIGTLRFYHSTRPAEFRKEILHGMAAVIVQGDLADMAVEDLRRWKWWDLTELVLAQYGKPTHAAPIVKRSILRYALCCPAPEAAAFVKACRAAKADLVKDVEESLAFEKPPPAKTP